MLVFYVHKAGGEGGTWLPAHSTFPRRRHVTLAPRRAWQKVPLSKSFQAASESLAPAQMRRPIWCESKNDRDCLYLQCG